MAPLNERQFGDYTLHYRRPEMGDEQHMITAMHGEQKVGSLRWYPKEITGVDVDAEHQRKGVATAMWNMGQEIRPRPKHSAERTGQGQLWAKAVGGRLPRWRP